MSERILVCGGREYDDEGLVFSTLDYYAKKRGVMCIINGGACGADALATAWASARCVPCLIYAAQWERHGNAAGPIRNQRMLDGQPRPTLVIAFPGGRGTADMVRRARSAGIEVVEIPATAAVSPDVAGVVP